MANATAAVLNKKRIEDLSPEQLKGQRVLVRVDFNVPFEGGVVGDDTRLRAALPTIQALQAGGAKVVLASHLGRPKGVTPALSLKPIAEHLAGLLGAPVAFVPTCVGPEAVAATRALAEGGVLLLENLRFHPEEEANDPAFCAQLAELCELFVNDAFGTAHRAHASTAGIAALRPAIAGKLMVKEIEAMGQALESPERPLVAIVGGSKVSSKIKVLEHLLPKVEVLVVGGAMANTFLKAKGISVGTSLVEDDQVAVAARVLEAAAIRQVRLLLPSDVVVAKNPKDEAGAHTVDVGEIPADEMALDVGPKTLNAYQQALATARTVIWNGPVGVFEVPAFAAGTTRLAKLVAEATDRGAMTIVGGGDSVAAVEQNGLAERMSHVSTGGGASLEFLEGKSLPGVAALNER